MTLTLIAGSANTPLARGIGRALGVEPRQCLVERFDDGELHVEIKETVRGHDVYVIQPTNRPVDEHLMELVFLADACRRAGAARMTAVVPYFGYARQDRRAAGREAVGARIVASLIEAAGFARVVAVDLHAVEIEGFFHIPVEHLSAAPLLAAALQAPRDAVIVAPDLGAVKLAERYQRVLHLPVVVVHKTRISGSEVSVRSVIGDVTGKAPLIIDDMITTGATVAAAARSLIDAGCRPEMCVASTHALFVGPAVARLQPMPIRQLLGTNSVDMDVPVPAQFQVVNLAPLLAEAIGRLNRDESLEHLIAHA